MPAETATAILKAENVTCDYGGIRALDDIDLEVHPSTVHGVIGPNGAGKTTLIKVLTGDVKPTKGSVFFQGRRIDQVRARHRVKLGMGRCFQITSIFHSLTVLENVRLAFQAHDGIRSFNLLASAGARDWTRSSALEVIDLVGLKDNATALAGEISYGEQRLLEIALALAGQPKLLLLDEPAAGIGLSELSHLSALISELARRYTVLLIEHNVEMVMQLCQIITVLYRGHVLTTGSPRDIAENEDVNAVYLGGG